MSRGFTLLALIAAASVLVTAQAPTGVTAQHKTADTVTVHDMPADLEDIAWMKTVGDAQIRTVASSEVFHDFQFTDRVSESGITFVHRIVDDAGKTYKAAHYDHGNGMVVADVDGDGRPDIYFVNQVGGNQLWRNLGGGKFEDITAAAGVAVQGRIGVSASFADSTTTVTPTST